MSGWSRPVVPSSVYAGSAHFVEVNSPFGSDTHNLVRRGHKRTGWGPERTGPEVLFRGRDVDGARGDESDELVLVDGEGSLVAGAVVPVGVAVLVVVRAEPRRKRRIDHRHRPARATGSGSVQVRVRKPKV